jgi:16S rRNA G527 N7-methylase RsmG
MDAARIAELLDPFLDAKLAPEQLDQISIYIDLLLGWNARINLTATKTRRPQVESLTSAQAPDSQASP